MSQRVVLVLAVLFLGVSVASPSAVAQEQPQAEHVDQQDLYDLVASGDPEAAFELAFEGGSKLFTTVFNSLDGVGVHVTDGIRFSRVPRADLTGFDEWPNHFPQRATGPNGQMCNSCHGLPVDIAAGRSSSNVVRDPLHTARLSAFIQRNPPHLFAAGALQRLAEEMTDQLIGIREEAGAEACRLGLEVRGDLVTKGVSYGAIVAIPVDPGPGCSAKYDTSEVAGIDDDLIVKPYQWKGNFAFLRDFNRDAFHQELGMQAVEFVGRGEDGDYDGVLDEMTVGDQTAVAIFLASQPRPLSLIELDHFGLIDPLPAEQVAAIQSGFQQFLAVGCDVCHRPTLELDDPVFSEPSQSALYRDAVFPGGLDPLSELVDPEVPVTFDLTADQPDNVVELPDGREIRLGSLRTKPDGTAIVNLFGDLKRHDMGEELAEPVDETGSGASVWMTKELWGVGSTGPWLHDGRASTLTEAILTHGGEAAASRAEFEELTQEEQNNLIAFLENLVLFRVAEEDDAVR